MRQLPGRRRSDHSRPIDFHQQLLFMIGMIDGQVAELLTSSLGSEQTPLRRAANSAPAGPVSPPRKRVLVGQRGGPPFHTLPEWPVHDSLARTQQYRFELL